LRRRFADLEAAASVGTTWARKQDDGTDLRTRFIYDCYTLRRVRELARERSLNADDELYAIHRWKNTRRHDTWLAMLLALVAEMREHAYAHERHIDFWWQLGGVDTAFDLKVTRWPRSVDRDATPTQLVDWLYANQSRQGRYSSGSRLFVVGRREADLYDFGKAFAAASAFADQPGAHLVRPVANAVSTAALIVVGTVAER